MSSETNVSLPFAGLLDAPAISNTPQSPIDQVKVDITLLEAEREQLSGRFQEIEAALRNKCQQVEVWTMIMANKDMQTKLLEQIQAAGIGPQTPRP